MNKKTIFIISCTAICTALLTWSFSSFSNKSATLIRKSEGTDAKIKNSNVHIIANKEQTGGAWSMMRYTAAPMDGPGLHIHQHADEIFYVIDGTLTVQVEEEKHVLNAGDFILIPKGAKHTNANLTDKPVDCMVLFSPGGTEGMFPELAAYLKGLKGKPEVAKMNEIGAKYGSVSVGPPLRQ